MSESHSARSVMTSDVVTLHPEQTLAEAADVLAERRIGAAPVVDADGRIVGILRDQDLILGEARIHVPTTIALLPGVEFTLPSHLARFDQDLKRAVGSTVADVMAAEPTSAGPDATVEDLATIMQEHDVTHVPIVDDDGRLVGIVARSDLVQYLARTT